MKILIIDTSVFLGFHEMKRKEAMKPLEELRDLLRDDKLKMLLPEQTKEEYIRRKNNLASDISESFSDWVKNLEKIKAPLLPPALSNKEHLDKTREIEKNLLRVVEICKEMKEKFVDSFLDENHKINALIEDLFKAAKMLKTSEQIMQKARDRVFKGHPPYTPQKRNSHGDTIIWETILANPSDEETVFVSYDNDWFDPLRNDEPSLFLRYEWQKVSRSKLVFKKTLGEALNYIAKNKLLNKADIEAEKSLAASWAEHFIDSYIAKHNSMNIVDHSSLASAYQIAHSNVYSSGSMLANLLNQYAVKGPEAHTLDLLASSAKAILDKRKTERE